VSSAPLIEKEHDIFLSHTGSDKDWVRTLGDRLEQEGIEDRLDSRRIKVFFDEWDVDYGENIVNRLNEGLLRSRYLAAILSPEFLESNWANQEWTHWFMDDPRASNLIPVLYRDSTLDGKRRIDLPMPFKTTRFVDFRERTQFERAFEQLLRRIRGLRPQRGEFGLARYSRSSSPTTSSSSGPDKLWDADAIQEIIVANLLEVKSLPITVWSGTTPHEKPEQVWQAIPDAGVFIIREHRLWTFIDLSHDGEPLRQAIDISSVRPTPVREWIGDDNKLRWLMAILNAVLRNRMGKVGIKKDAKGRFYFKANSDGTPRKWANAGDREREVAAKKVSADGTSYFYVHAAAHIKFEKLGERFFVKFEPTYTFTEDGEMPLAPKATGKLAIRWSGQQRNDTIVRNLLFWTKLVTKNQKEFGIPTGGEEILISGVPASTRTERGIETDEVQIGALLNIGAEDQDDLAEAASQVELVGPPEEEDAQEEEN
jgi:TIR domain